MLIEQMLKTPEWDTRYEVGISEIDLQHQNFLKLVKKVELFGEGKIKQMTINDILDEIFLYAQFHFKSEENLMKEFDYPEIEKHKREHKLLADHLLLEVNNLKIHPDDIKHLHKYLVDWLLEHILAEDTKLAKTLKNIT